VLLGVAAHAALLEKSAWKVIGPDGRPIPVICDENLDTAWTALGAQVPGQAVRIDLGEAYVVSRVVLDPGANHFGYPRSLDIYAGLQPDALTLAGSMTVPDDFVKVITFNPVVARYLRLVIGAEGAGYPWSIAEVEIYGHRNPKAFDAGNAVVVAPDAPELVRLAAEDLGFYLGQVTEDAFPVVSPADAWKYGGVRFRVLVPGIPSSNMSFQQALSLERYWITRSGNEVTLQGQTLRAIVYAVKEILERHGVRWTYPAALCDLIPARRALDLSFLPYNAQPPIYVRKWNNGVGGSLSSERFRWLVRSGLNSDWGTLINALGPTSSLNRIGWGLTHSMSNIWGNDAEKQHPDWYAGTAHKSGWNVVPDVTAPGLIDFILGRMKEDEATNKAAKEPRQVFGYGIHPLDVPSWAVSDRAEKLLGPFRKTEPEGSDDAAMNFDYSNLYGYLLNETAKRMQQELPGKLLGGTAYENHRLAPTKIDKFPSNLFMLLCLHEQPYNLPLTSPQHLGERTNIEAWSKKCSMLGVWDYILLDEHKTKDWHTPTPLVTALVDRYSWMAAHGFVYLGTQGIEDPDCPWNVYAFAQVIYNPKVQVKQVEDTFFVGYYREAAAPMQAYYTTLENYLLTHNIGLSGSVINFSYEPNKEAFPPALVAQLRTDLAAAQRAAKHGFVKARVRRACDALQWAVDFAGQT